MVILPAVKAIVEHQQLFMDFTFFGRASVGVTIRFINCQSKSRFFRGHGLFTTKLLTPTSPRWQNRRECHAFNFIMYQIFIMTTALQFTSDVIRKRLNDPLQLTKAFTFSWNICSPPSICFISAKSFSL